MGFLSATLSSEQPSIAEVMAEANRICQRIVSASNPRDVYIFGSAVTGSFKHTSDIDLLIVFDDEEQLKQGRRKLIASRASDVHLKWPVDYIFVTKVHFDAMKDLGGICMVAYQQGKKLCGK